MPSIKKDEKQQQALAEISDGLATIRALNPILATGWNGNIIINYDTGESGRNKFVRLTLDPKKNERDWAAVLKMASQHKTRLVKDIKNKALKFAIGLDKNDHLVMGPADIAVREDVGAAHDSAEDEGSDPLTQSLNLEQGDSSSPGGGPAFAANEEDIDPYEGETQPDPESY